MKSTPAPPRLAVVVVSYNTANLLRACLRSVLNAAARHQDDLTVDVVVVDNASSDGSAEMVTRDFPGAHLIASATNLGFTGGNNAALRRLGLLDDLPLPPEQAPPLPTPDFVLLLNPDAEVQGDALLRLVRFLQQTPGAGACGPRLAYGDGSFQHGAFDFPGLAQIALDLFPLHQLPGARRLYAGRLNGRYPRPLWDGSEPFEVGFVLGAALLARAGAVRAVGGLDETFFMYCEEMDWCLRIRDAGWRIYAVPAARVVHHEGQSSRQARWRSFQRLWRSRFLFYDKHRDRFGPLLPAARVLVRAAMAWGSLRAWRQFARGRASGTDAAEERAARRSVGLL